MRRDLHRLYDLGFVTVTPDHQFAVSDQLREDWHNGRTYYELHGRSIALPSAPSQQPDVSLLDWHAQEVFRA